MRKGFHFLLIFGLPLVTVLSIWAWEVRAQNAQGTTATPPANGKWECMRFDFVRREPDLGNSTGDLEAFLQTARQVQLVSSGLPALGVAAAVRKPL